MSEDNKNLGDDLNDMLDDAKDGARKAADGAKEKASEFADDAKREFNEFKGEAQEVLSDGKNVAIIAHITLIGWIIALVMNSGEKKSEFASFYIRQMLGLMLIGIVTSFIPFIGLIIGLLMLVLWIMSLVGALGGDMKPTPILGQYFQDWFKGL